MDLLVYYLVFFLEGRRGGVHDVPVRFDSGSCTPPLTDAIWDSGQTSFLSIGSIYVCIHTISRSIRWRTEGPQLDAEL